MKEYLSRQEFFFNLKSIFSNASEIAGSNHHHLPFAKPVLATTKRNDEADE